MVRSQRIIRIFAERGIVEQGLGQLDITPSGSHFFNKTDLEQYLFKYRCFLRFNVARRTLNQ